MESYESFTKQIRNKEDQQHTVDRQLHDVIDDFDNVFQPRVTLRQEKEPASNDIHALSEQLKTLFKEYSYILQERLAEDSKLEYQINNLQPAIESFISLATELSKKDELVSDDILQWNKEKDHLLSVLNVIHMTIAGTVSSMQRLDTPDRKN